MEPSASIFYVPIDGLKPSYVGAEKYARGCCKFHASSSERWHVPARYRILLLLVWGFTVQMALRAVMSVTILAMEEPAELHFSAEPDLAAKPDLPAKFNLSANLRLPTKLQSSLQRAKSAKFASPAAVELPAELEVPAQESLAASQQFNTLRLDGFTRGMVLSAFYWGYVVSQLPGGRLAERFGAKLVLGASQGICSLLALALPLMAHHAGSAGVIAVRLLQGLATGPVYPSLYPVLARWFPADERQTASALVTAAQLLGLGAVSPAAGQLCQTLGWPSVFYLTGGCGMLWLLCWMLWMHDAPATHPAACPCELERIGARAAPVHAAGAPPYAAILTSPPVWAIVCGEIANSWGQTFLLTFVPLYLKDAVGLDVRTSSLLSGVPHVGRGLLGLLLGINGDLALRRRWLAPLTLRRLSTATSFAGVCGSLLVLSAIGTHPAATTALFCLAGLFTSFSGLGYPLNTIDVSPSYCGTVFGLANTLGGAASLLSPLAAGAILDGSTGVAMLQQWRLVFWLAAGVYLLGLVAYLAMASAERQPWDSDDDVTEQNVEAAEKDVEKR